MLTIDTLPNDVKEKLPEEVQHLYIAAYNSFFENSHDEGAATKVAWQTIERNEHYGLGQDGKWHRLAEEDGGAHDKALGVAPQS
jgi:cation transport regulator